MVRVDNDRALLEGSRGTLSIRKDDEVAWKFLMLCEGECEGGNRTEVAAKFGFSRQRYYQLLKAFHKGGAVALKGRKSGPKTNYRRTAEVVRQVIRYRFLDPDASAEVVAQKLRQCGWKISNRSVARVIQEHGLQKKTPQVPT